MYVNVYIKIRNWIWRTYAEHNFPLYKRFIVWIRNQKHTKHTTYSPTQTNNKTYMEPKILFYSHRFCLFWWKTRIFSFGLVHILSMQIKKISLIYSIYAWWKTRLLAWDIVCIGHKAQSSKLTHFPLKYARHVSISLLSTAFSPFSSSSSLQVYWNNK